MRATVSPTGRIDMSGAMNASMNGPPPGRVRRDICWIRARPPGRSLSRMARVNSG